MRVCGSVCVCGARGGGGSVSEGMWFSACVGGGEVQ